MILYDDDSVKSEHRMVKMRLLGLMQSSIKTFK